MPKTKKGSKIRSINTKTPENDKETNKNTIDCQNSFSSALQQYVPDTVSFDFNNDKVSTKSIIEDANKLAITKAYTENESARVKRQKWLLLAVVLFTACQLLFFNFVIHTTVTKSFQTAQLESISNIEVINNFFDILKYYIGATVVELIGMILFITKGTFSSDHVKTMELLLKNNLTKQNKQANQ